MRIRYVYSACVSIETDDCTVLCDPWWTPAYEGAWAQWPVWARSLDEAVKVCGPADYVYVSHLHPDHYDPAFLRAYCQAHPSARLLIAEQDPPLLERKLRARGAAPRVGLVTHGETVLSPLRNRANQGLNIDSALVVRDRRHGAINLNDNPFDPSQIEAVTAWLRGCATTVGLFPFVGAGPWPQCYALEPDAMRVAAARKKAHYLELFQRYCAALQPTVAVPFAGQYVLHGPRLDLNPLRGMADATECRDSYGCVWVPADGGSSTVTLDGDAVDWNTERTKPYDWPAMRRRLYDDCRLRYERELHVPPERLPLLTLLQSAARKAYPSFKRREPAVHIYIKAEPLPQWFYAASDRMTVQEVAAPTVEPRTEVTLDARLLFGMLTRLYNANSVRIGSLCTFRDVPAAFDQARYDLFGEYWDSLRV